MHDMPLSLLDDTDEVIRIGKILRLRNLNFHDTVLRSAFTEFLENARKEDIKGEDARRRKICIGEFGFVFISPLDVEFRSGILRRNRLSVEAKFSAFLDFIHRQYFRPTQELIRLRLEDLERNAEARRAEKELYLTTLRDCLDQQASDLIRTRVGPLRYRRALEALFDEHAMLDYYASSPEDEKAEIVCFFDEGTPHRDSSDARKRWTICLIRLTAAETEAIFGRSPIENVLVYSPLKCLVVFERVLIGKQYFVVPIVKISLRTEFDAVG